MNRAVDYTVDAAVPDFVAAEVKAIAKERMHSTVKDKLRLGVSKLPPTRRERAANAWRKADPLARHRDLKKAYETDAVRNHQGRVVPGTFRSVDPTRSGAKELQRKATNWVRKFPASLGPGC